jgi:hypothetical protein
MDQPDPEPSPTSAREQRTMRRLQTFVDEPLVSWTQGWVSREIRLHGVFASRTLDFAVLTDKSLGLVSTGFFSRRPHRRVFLARLEDVKVANETVGRGRRLRIHSTGGRPLRLELRDNPKTAAFATALVARAPGLEPEATREAEPE